MSSAWHLGLVMLLAAGGCEAINKFEDPALVGKWKGVDVDFTIDADVDGDGKSTIGANVTDPVTQQVYTGYVRYKVDWEQKREDKFELKLRCQESEIVNFCPDLEWECKVNDDADKLTCQETSNPPVFGLGEVKLDLDD